ncbi:hypothetical protein L345_12511, partial [Ophiophagus hannah]
MKFSQLLKATSVPWVDLPLKNSLTPSSLILPVLEELTRRRRGWPILQNMGGQAKNCGCSMTRVSQEEETWAVISPEWCSRASQLSQGLDTLPNSLIPYCVKYQAVLLMSPACLGGGKDPKALYQSKVMLKAVFRFAASLPFGKNRGLSFKHHIKEKMIGLRAKRIPTFLFLIPTAPCSAVQHRLLDCRQFGSSNLTSLKADSAFHPSKEVLKNSFELLLLYSSDELFFQNGLLLNLPPTQCGSKNRAELVSSLIMTRADIRKEEAAFLSYHKKRQLLAVCPLLVHPISTSTPAHLSTCTLWEFHHWKLSRRDRTAICQEWCRVSCLGGGVGLDDLTRERRKERNGKKRKEGDGNGRKEMGKGRKEGGRGREGRKEGRRWEREEWKDMGMEGRI